MVYIAIVSRLSEVTGGTLLAKEKRKIAERGQQAMAGPPMVWCEFYILCKDGLVQHT